MTPYFQILNYLGIGLNIFYPKDSICFKAFLAVRHCQSSCQMIFQHAFLLCSKKQNLHDNSWWIAVYKPIFISHQTWGQIFNVALGSLIISHARMLNCAEMKISYHICWDTLQEAIIVLCVGKEMDFMQLLLYYSIMRYCSQCGETGLKIVFHVGTKFSRLKIKIQ